MTRVLIHDGATAQESTLDTLCALPDRSSFAWLHIDGATEDPRTLIARLSDMPDAALNALVAQETRPRCTFMADGALVNLRGLGEQRPQDSDPLVSIRIWAERGRIISVSYRRLDALEPLTQRMLSGALRDPGDLIAALADEITDALDPKVAWLGDCLDDIESAMSDDGPAETRKRVSGVRAQAIAYRRFIAPQRLAIERLATADAPWLDETDHVHLRESADRCARMAEELEAVRERAALTHEALTDLRAEEMNQRALVLSIVALVFLPLTFLTGLLGMNVAGIPYAEEPWAFWGVMGVCLLIAVAITAWFSRAHWLGK